MRTQRILFFLLPLISLAESSVSGVQRQERRQPGEWSEYRRAPFHETSSIDFWKKRSNGFGTALKLRAGDSTGKSVPTAPSKFSASSSLSFTRSVWLIPSFTAVISFLSFDSIHHLFHSLLGDSSASSSDSIDPQTHLLGQFISGRVVTCISCLLAALVAITITTLQRRQSEVQKSLLQETQSIRKLKASMVSPLFRLTFSDLEQRVMLDCIELFHAKVKQECRVPMRRPNRARNPQDYIESDPGRLLAFCDQLQLINTTAATTTKHAGSGRDVAGSGRDRAPLLSSIRDLIHQIQIERTNRYIAVMTMNFPPAHYFLLGLTMVSILVAFLTATSVYPEIMISIKTRMLWSLITTCLASIASVCRVLEDVFSNVRVVDLTD